MKALLLKELGSDLQYTEAADPVPASDDMVIVELKAAAFNRRDYWITKGMYKGIDSFPIILGSDGCGEYQGKQVVLCPNINWGPGYFPSKDYKILGLEHNGTFAQKVAISKKNIYPKPAHLTIEQAAALPLGGLTAFRALFSRAGLRAGEKVLISGVGGGVALIACQMAIAIGAQVYVSSGSEIKIQKAIELGARGGANYKNQDQMKKLASDIGGFDVVLDSAGGDGFQTLLKMCNTGARVSIYGGTAGNLNNISAPNLFFKQLSILGSTMGSDVEFKKMLEFVHHYNIIPVVDKQLSLENGQEGLNRLESGNQFGKIILNIP